MKKCFQVFLCVVYTLNIKLTHQIPLAAVTEALKSTNISNASNQPASQNATEKRKYAKRAEPTSTTVFYTVPVERRRELVRNYFPYTFRPQYEDFYEWFYRVLTDEKRKEERLTRGMALTTLHVDYDGILAKSKYPIPPYHQSWYAYVTEMERLFNITTNVFYTGHPDQEFYYGGIKYPPTKLR